MAGFDREHERWWRRMTARPDRGSGLGGFSVADMTGDVVSLG